MKITIVTGLIRAYTAYAYKAYIRIIVLKFLRFCSFIGMYLNDGDYARLISFLKNTRADEHLVTVTKS